MQHSENIQINHYDKTRVTLANPTNTASHSDRKPLVEPRQTHHQAPTCIRKLYVVVIESEALTSVN